MNEQCPLVNPGNLRGTESLSIPIVPAVCMSQCESLWSAAIIDGARGSEYEIYEDSECEHEASGLEYSHSALQLGEGAYKTLRFYVSVDQCEVDGI
jgi:hypothetical protein